MDSDTQVRKNPQGEIQGGLFYFFFLFLPEAVTDHLTLFGPVFFLASLFDIFPATALGLHAG